ncbi:MAG: carboxypeptidase-like regulatory domain-containing protein, partial [Bacteroidota bacterium]
MNRLFTLASSPLLSTRGRAQRIREGNKRWAGLFPLLLCLLSPVLSAQVSTASSSGKVTDLISDLPVDFTTIYVKGTTSAVESSSTGRYLINVPAGEDFVLVFSRLGYRETSVEVSELPEGSRKQIDVALAPAESTLEVVVRESKIEEGGMIR